MTLNPCRNLTFRFQRLESFLLPGECAGAPCNHFRFRWPEVQQLDLPQLSALLQYCKITKRILLKDFSPENKNPTEHFKLQQFTK